MSSAGNIIDVLEELIEQMDIVSRNPMKPTLGVEERFGIQRGYYEQELLEKDDIYSLALSFQDSLNRGKHTNPTYLSGVGEVEAEAILRSKVFDILEEVGFGVNYINISYSPTDLGVRIEGEGQEMTFYYYAVGDEWKLVDVEVE